ncbi:unnamed protein product [Echinostoma caproni]|uniref:Uncharacterized protein n=1 Tax=Echinostoma caproni TaxID=27848 RepID=A0A183BC62_9TREM|nr:unnamed protein product [Echinostoma caproni]
MNCDKHLLLSIPRVSLVSPVLSSTLQGSRISTFSTIAITTSWHCAMEDPAIEPLNLHEVPAEIEESVERFKLCNSIRKGGMQKNLKSLPLGPILSVDLQAPERAKFNLMSRAPIQF